ncbi:hypothetical protein MUK42_36902 [Musa troglodytarum]|uniref:Uncharacterized protein n=1 Tax=Musa troglodytarum TaxID=320322 RepID=A0A9E7EAL8_9LILI|nr:hypothetical protein MUK42_36902 [Musa troglodytarum]
MAIILLDSSYFAFEFLHIMYPLLHLPGWDLSQVHPVRPHFLILLFVYQSIPGSQQILDTRCRPDEKSQPSDD